MSLDSNFEAAKDPNYWRKAAAELHWDTPFEHVLEYSTPPFAKWFTGGKINTCYNAIDRHVEAGRGDAVALIYDSAMTGDKRQFTYRELQNEVASVAGMLKAQGVSKGDRVVIYLSLIHI